MNIKVKKKKNRRNDQLDINDTLNNDEIIHLNNRLNIQNNNEKDNDFNVVMDVLNDKSNENNINIIDNISEKSNINQNEKDNNSEDENSLLRSKSYNQSIRKRNISGQNENIFNELNNNLLEITTNSIDNIKKIDNKNSDLIDRDFETEIIKEECEKMIHYFEHIYIIVFFFAFVLYCIIMFSLIPKY